MPTPRTLTLDPATGEAATLGELAERYGLSCQSLENRYRRGKRGAELVESVEETRLRAGRQAAISRAKKGRKATKQAPPTARELADQVLATREGRLASRLLKHYAA